MIYANPGTISHGTLCAEDLIPVFSSELADLVNKNAEEWYGGTCIRDAYLALINCADELGQNDDGTYSDIDETDSTLEELFDALQDFAPPYFYFGSYPGDGSDFGFWLSDDFNHEFPGLSVSDLSEVPEDYCGEVAVISDHGDISLYLFQNVGSFSDGAPKIESTCLWAIV